MINLLPVIIQKYIIKILCKHIDKDHRFIDTIGKDGHYRRNEKDIKLLALQMVLVSRDWFQMVSNNLHVAVDFNYSDNQWSILKPNNIKTLKVHYDHSSKKVYTLVNGKSKDIEFKEVNEKIEKLSSCENGIFKTFIFRNISIDRSLNNTVKQELDLVYKCNATENNVHVYEICLNETTTLEELEVLAKQVKKVYLISINKCMNKQVILKAFELWSKKLSYIDQIHVLTTGFPLYQILSGQDTTTKGVNHLSNIVAFRITEHRLTIKDLVIILNSSKSTLKDLKFNICYRNLTHFLTTCKEKKNYFSKRCECESIIKRSQELKEDSIEFKKDWSNLIELISSNKSMSSLCINFDCNVYGGVFQVKKQAFPQSFVKGICSLVAPNVTEFMFMSSITAQVFQELLKTNKTITRFEAASIEDHSNFEKLQGDLNELIEKHNHIQRLTLTKYQLNEARTNYNTILLIDHKK